MRNRMGGISAAAMAGAAVLLSLAVSFVLAQVPGGSYLRTCSDVGMSGDRLVAQCDMTEQPIAEIVRLSSSSIINPTRRPLLHLNFRFDSGRARNFVFDGV